MESNSPDLAGSNRAVQSITLLPEWENTRQLGVDRWLAASVLQKSIRRGHSGLAKRAGLALLSLHPNAFWRRLTIIAWEDIAFGDLECCEAVTLVARSPDLRAELGDRCIALSLIDRMAKAAKNRVADDIVTIIENDNCERQRALTTAELDEQSLRAAAYPADRCLTVRTVAAWMLIGTSTVPSDLLPKRKGDTKAFFRAFPDEQLPRGLAESVEIATRHTRTLLAATTALLHQEWQQDGSIEEFVEDDLLANDLLGEIPEYAFDGHTRGGCRYLRKLSRAHLPLNLWLQEHVGEADHLPMLKKLFFRAVSSQCNVRQAWGRIEQLRNHADSVGFLLDQSIFREGLSIFKDGLAEYPVKELIG